MPQHNVRMPSPFPRLLPGPSTALALARSAAARVAGTVTAAAGAPARALALLDGAEAVLAQITELTRRAESLIDRAEAVTASAAGVVADAERVTGRAATAVTRAEGTAATADELLTAYEGTLRAGAPMAARFVAQLTPEEVTAAIRLVDELPRLTHHLTTDVLPILATLDRVGPDIHDLLEVTRDLKLAVAGIPGLRMLRRRGEDRLAANLANPAAPGAADPDAPRTG